MTRNSIMKLSEIVILNNSIMTWLIALGVFFLTLLLMRWFKMRCLRGLTKYSKHTKTRYDDFIIDAFSSLPNSFFIIVGVYVGSKFLFLSHTITSVIYVSFVILALSQLGVTLGRVILYILQNTYFDGEEGKHTISFLRMVVNIIVGAIVLLMILNNLGVAITPLITSLGIAGVAVAFSLKNILEDLFSSISIFIDKPFLIGDYIEVGSASGTVTTIGIKTTRMTTTRGEELVISNRTLTNETIRNYGKMNHRTISENFIIPYNGDFESLDKIPKKVKKMFKKIHIKGVRLIRIYLTSLQENGAQYSYRYTIDSKDYELYLQVQQEVNVEILKILHKRKTGIATPVSRIISKK